MKNQFEIIRPWIPVVLAEIKKDIKVDHLPKSPIFVKTHFGNRPLNRVTIEELFTAYQKDLLAGDADLAEWVINRWVFKHGDIYTHFAERLQQISENFSELESLTEAQSEKILDGAVEQFGTLSVYLFAVLNGVVFSDAVFARLRAAAEKEEIAKHEEEQRTQAWKSLEAAQEQYQRNLTRLQEKYDAKIAGVMKKYATDTEALKKQIRALQKQLNAQ